MRALIFAAGRGERMRPLTDTTPKPLLEIRGKPIIAWHLERLAHCGIRDVVINTSHLGEQFPQILGDGSGWGIRIHYADEGPRALETGGGMLHALPLLGNEPFMALNGDIFTDFDFTRLPADPAGLAHLVLVDNPLHHPQGDFTLQADSKIAACESEGRRLTFAGIGVYRPELLSRYHHGDEAAFKLAPLLVAAMKDGLVTGEHHEGQWTDVGTPERLAALNVD